jgi:hypothetical protein
VISSIFFSITAAEDILNQRFVEENKGERRTNLVEAEAAKTQNVFSREKKI